jgi:hypothetical protein
MFDARAQRGLGQSVADKCFEFRERVRDLPQFHDCGHCLRRNQ